MKPTENALQKLPAIAAIRRRACDLAWIADVAQEGGIGDVVVADVVDLEATRAAVAQQHVGRVAAEETAEASELPSGSDLAEGVRRQDRIIADVVNLVLAVGTVTQNHAGGGAGERRRVRSEGCKEAVVAGADV